MPPSPVQEKLLTMSRAFMESRILLSGAELDLFTLLADIPLTAAEIADRTKGHLRPLVILLDALTAIGVLEKAEGCYRTVLSHVPYLSSKSPDSVLPMILHAATLWKTWSNLTTIVTDSDPRAGHPELFSGPKDLKAFIGAMHVVGQGLARQVVPAFNLGPARNIIDIGGGSGTYTIACLQASPDLRATLFDKPEVLDMARERLSAEGCMDRVTLVGGDFYHDPLPAGHDLALISAIIHQNSYSQNVELFSKAYACLTPGGRILIRDHVMEPDRTEPKAGAIFAVNMLVNTPSGGTFTFEEIKSGLEEAGFSRVTLLKKGERMDGLVEAFRP